jgi:hypothetical protein
MLKPTDLGDVIRGLANVQRWDSQNIKGIYFSILTSAQQSAMNQQGALAEWLTRTPAKGISSEACVRITQASIHNMFFVYNLYSTSYRHWAHT